MVDPAVAMPFQIVRAAPLPFQQPGQHTGVFHSQSRALPQVRGDGVGRVANQ